MSYLDDMFSLKGRIAIVTGGARGNGKAIAEGLLKADAVVIICDVLRDELKQTIEEFSHKYGSTRVQGQYCDLTNDKDFSDFLFYIKNNYVGLGRVDILVNNAGITRGNHFLDYTEEDWQATLKVNLEVPRKLSQFVGSIMKEQGSGSIINITSLNSEQGFSGNPAYVASKGALKQLTKAMAVDLGKYGIRVNNVGPGYFKTNMTSKSWANEEMRKARSDRTILGRWGDPEDLAGVIVFLASDSSSYITGQDIYVDGGWLAKGV